MARLRKYFITGILVLLPLVITLYVLSFVIIFLDGLLAGVVAKFLGFPLPGLGLLLTVLIVLLVGMIATNVLGKKIIDFFDHVFIRIPMVKTLYGAIKQIIDAFSVQPRDAFRRVAMVEYPRKGIYAMGFITGEGVGEIQEKTFSKVSSIFIPTTPNPTSGMLLFVPQSEIIFLDMSVEEGLKLIISGGVVNPPQNNKKEVTG